MLLVAHVLGCFWFFQTTLAAEGEPTWVTEYDSGSARDGPVSKQYLHSLLLEPPSTAFRWPSTDRPRSSTAGTYIPSTGR